MRPTVAQVRRILGCHCDEATALLAGLSVENVRLVERFEALMQVAEAPVPPRPATARGNPLLDVRVAVAQEKAAKAARVAALREANRRRLGITHVADSAR